MFLNFFKIFKSWWLEIGVENDYSGIKNGLQIIYNPLK